MKDKRKRAQAKPRRATPAEKPLAAADVHPSVAAAIARGVIARKKLAAAEGGAVLVKENACPLGNSGGWDPASARLPVGRLEGGERRPLSHVAVSERNLAKGD